METKIECKVFFITDFNQQAQYLTEMHRKGWRLTKIRWSFFYHFEKCEPEDVAYQVDFKESKITDMSAIDAVNKITGRYAKLNKTVHLRHLSADCRTLLKNADSEIDVNILEDPTYKIVGD